LRIELMEKAKEQVNCRLLAER